MRVEGQNYFDMIVAPTCADYFREPWSLRRACLALVAISHQVDYYAIERYTGPLVRSDMDKVLAQRRKPLLLQHPQLRAIKDAADAVKHGRLSTLTSKGDATPRHPAAVDELQVTKGLFQAPFGHGRLAEAMDVHFEDSDGHEVSVRRLLTDGLAFWQSKLSSSPPTTAP